jgi:transcriptional antiterminator NusG
LSVNIEPDNTNASDDPAVRDAAVPTVAPGADINAPGTDAALPPASSQHPENEPLPLQAEIDAGAIEEDEPLIMGPAEPLMDISAEEEQLEFRWYILKVQVNREDSIREALLRRIRMEGVERYFGDIVVPTEDIREYTKSGKARVVKRKLYPGYIVVNMAVNDDTWFLVRDTPGIGDFTGSAGRPAPLPEHEVHKLLRISKPDEEGKKDIKTTINFKQGEHVRVKDGNFQNFEGDVDTIDEANGRVTVMINIFGRSTPVELEHWQIEKI